MFLDTMVSAYFYFYFLLFHKLICCGTQAYIRAPKEQFHYFDDILADLLQMLQPAAGLQVILE